MPEYVNTHTGEIVDSTASPRRRQHLPKKYVGEETKYPQDCITADSLLETLRQLDGSLHHKVGIDYAYLADSLTGRFLTVAEVVLLTHIGRNLIGWNYWMGNRGTLTSELPDIRVRSKLKLLVEKDLVRILHQDKPFKNDLVLQVAPTIAFKGGYDWRENAVKNWYCVSALSGGTKSDS